MATQAVNPNVQMHNAAESKEKSSFCTPTTMILTITSIATAAMLYLYSQGELASTFSAATAAVTKFASSTWALAAANPMIAGAIVVGLAVAAYMFKDHIVSMFNSVCGSKAEAAPAKAGTDLDALKQARAAAKADMDDAEEALDAAEAKAEQDAAARPAANKAQVAMDDATEAFQKANEAFQKAKADADKQTEEVKKD